MLKNQTINRKATIKVAKALGELNKEVVFVGGAMLSLYIDDPAAEDIRPTKDIDLTFQISTFGKLEELRVKLTEKGFKQSHEDHVICRFRFEDLLVDVMSTHAVDWAPSNRWFLPGFEKAITIELEETVIRILPLPYFLATKLEAFFRRGAHDLYASHDLEDILYIFNYTTDLVVQVLAADQELLDYLKACVERILGDDKIMAAIPAHLYYESADERMEIIIDKMKNIFNA
jgi:predicted nucleotidyltransferase